MPPLTSALPGEEEQELERAHALSRRVLEAGKQAMLAFAEGRDPGPVPAWCQEALKQRGRPQEAPRLQLAPHATSVDTAEDQDLEPAERPWCAKACLDAHAPHRRALKLPVGGRLGPRHQRKLEALLARFTPTQLRRSITYFYAPDASADWPHRGFPLEVWLKVAERHVGGPAPRRRVCRVCGEGAAADCDGPSGEALCRAHRREWEDAFDADHPALSSDDPSLEGLTRHERFARSVEDGARRWKLRGAHCASWLVAQQTRKAAP